MNAINITFDIPQTPTFDVEEFSRKVKAYANTLVMNVVAAREMKIASHRVLAYEELSPEIQTLVGICPGAVGEDDLNGNIAKEKALIEEYYND